MSPFKIRPATRSAAGTLAEIHRCSFTDWWDGDTFSALLNGKGTFAFIAWRGESPVGLVLARAIADESEILTFAVDPNARSAGGGRCLLRAAMNEARQRGALRMLLEVAETNVAARALYESTGFQHAGRRRGYYQPGECESSVATDALILVCELAARAKT